MKTKEFIKKVFNGEIIRVYYEHKNAMKLGKNTNIVNWQTIGKLEDYRNPQIKNNIRIKPLIAHTYWQGKVGEKQIFSIKSFICTQNMDYFIIYIWLDKQSFDESKKNILLQKLLNQYSNKIFIKCWDIDKEIKDTPANKYKHFFHFKGKPLPAIADDFRLIALYKYGGLYFDLDVMFCKDFIPLIMQGEFVYAWEKQPFANSAILFLNKKSYNAEYILKKVCKIKSSQPWAIFKYADTKLKHLIVYPCCMFDPLWNGYTEGMPIKNFEDFFKGFSNELKKDEKINSYKDFFNGIYAYHWHNQWKTPTTENSYWGLFNNEFDNIISNEVKRYD